MIWRHFNFIDTDVGWGKVHDHRLFLEIFYIKVLWGFDHNLRNLCKVSALRWRVVYHINLIKICFYTLTNFTKSSIIDIWHGAKCASALTRIYGSSSMKDTVCKKYFYLQFFWSVFSGIRIQYGYLLCKSPYSVTMRENTDQKNFEYVNFLNSDEIKPLVSEMFKKL